VGGWGGGESVGEKLGAELEAEFGPQMELAYRLIPISQGPKNSGNPGLNLTMRSI
jgi:hypothetical protein